MQILSEINHFEVYLLRNMMWQLMWRKWVYVLMCHVLIE
jgi:hypothetical protein